MVIGWCCVEHSLYLCYPRIVRCAEKLSSPRACLAARRKWSRVFTPHYVESSPRVFTHCWRRVVNTPRTSWRVVNTPWSVPSRYLRRSNKCKRFIHEWVLHVFFVRGIFNSQVLFLFCSAIRFESFSVFQSWYESFTSFQSYRLLWRLLNIYLYIFIQGAQSTLCCNGLICTYKVYTEVG